MHGLFPCNIAILFTTFSAKKIFPAVVVFIQTLFRIKSGKFWRTFPPLYILQQKPYDFYNRLFFYNTKQNKRNL